METHIKLKVKGSLYTTWQTITIQQSLIQIAGSFSFTASNRYAGEFVKWKIKMGDLCTVEIGGTTVLTGYIEEILDDYANGKHTITFRGRDKTADLVDCCFDFFTGGSEFKNLSVLQTITKLCASVKVDVTVDPTIEVALKEGTTKSKAIEVGEYIFDVIARYGRQYGFLPYTKGDGALFLGVPSKVFANDSLVQGVNLKANGVHWSIKERYSTYYVEGHRGQADGTYFIKSLNYAAEGVAIDYDLVNLGRVRPLVILENDDASNDTCQTRADWELNLRKGAGQRITSVVKGWVQSNGDVWKLNTRVNINDDKIQINAPGLITGVKFTLDARGEQTTLMLVPPDTFVLKRDKPAATKETKGTYFDTVANPGGS